jgi:hypothetical protein
MPIIIRGKQGKELTPGERARLISKALEDMKKRAYSEFANNGDPFVYIQKPDWFD